MKISEFLEIFREEFKKELNKKPSWGRNELEFLFEKICSNTFAKIMDKQNNKSI